MACCCVSSQRYNNLWKCLSHSMKYLGSRTYLPEDEYWQSCTYLLRWLEVATGGSHRRGICVFFPSLSYSHSQVVNFFKWTHHYFLQIAQPYCWVSFSCKKKFKTQNPSLSNSLSQGCICGLGWGHVNSRQIIIKFHTYTSCRLQSSFQVHDFIMINYYTFGVMRVGLLLHDLGSLSDKCFLINKV